MASGANVGSFKGGVSASLQHQIFYPGVATVGGDAFQGLVMLKKKKKAKPF